MAKSALQIARAAYQPKLPKALKGNVAIKEGKATESVADQAEIKKLFPNTYGMPVVTFEASNTPLSLKDMNVGVILSGGQAPGGHNVISGLFDGLKSMNKNAKLYGFLGGPSGLVDHKYIELTADIIDESLLVQQLHALPSLQPSLWLSTDACTLPLRLMPY